MVRASPAGKQFYDSMLSVTTEQTFGVDLEARARADRKRVPVIITTILTFLDNRRCPLILPVSNAATNDVLRLS